MTTDRDRAIESMLRRREIEASEPTDQCVDAESLAAWMEGGLSGDARATVEKHAAGCARCQALLASMARTAPDIEVRPWWRSVTAKWLVPVAAIATALVVWISVGREPAPPTLQQPAPQASVDSAPPQVAQTGDAEAQARKEFDEKLERRQDDKRRAPTDALRRQRQVVTDSSARSAAAASPPPAPAPVAASPAPVAGSPAPVAPPAAQPLNVASAEKPAPVGGLAESVSVSREFAAKQSAADAITVAGIEVQSPDPNYRWRIVPPTAIQRSTDGGTTWTVVDPLRTALRGGAETPTVLTAGSSPSRDVCWIVGR